MAKLLFIFFVCSASFLFSQNNLIKVDQSDKDIGVVENIYKIKVDYILQNNQEKNLYLLRADALKGITIHTSKKTIRPKDTALLVIEFVPQKTGKFNEYVNLVTSAEGTPFKLSLSGNIKSIKTDDKTACFYFKKPNNAGVKITEPIVVVESTKPRDVSNRIPDHTVNIENKKPEVNVETKPVDTKDEALLDDKLYKANNIIFLVDVSNSMKDTNKLKLMQVALHDLIDVLRPKDRITFITYADSVRIIKGGTNGNHKKELHEVVDKLKAKGLTKGNKAILFSLDVAITNYIPNGNNQIILATDGKFRFYPDDQKLYKIKQGEKSIKLSTIAFGNDKEAIKNLKDIAEIGNGNFIHIKSREKAKEQLLNEIKKNSMINQ
ncbi:MAG: von Willebrand factor type [Bacteroidota bacterium]|nr:von Willebrand factor type [Bacteroidota bacterium]